MQQLSSLEHPFAFPFFCFSKHSTHKLGNFLLLRPFFRFGGLNYRDLFSIMRNGD
jgi:hypothetical protein